MNEPVKPLEFAARLNDDRTLTVPPEVAAQLPPGRPLRVLLLVDDSEDERDWVRMATEEFLKGYAESDAIYDELHGG
jgi:hypothetical protein